MSDREETYDVANIPEFTIGDLFEEIAFSVEEYIKRSEEFNGQVWWRRIKQKLPDTPLPYTWKKVSGIADAPLGGLARLERFLGNEDPKKKRVAEAAHFALQTVRIPNGGPKCGSADVHEEPAQICIRKLMQVALNLGQMRGCSGHGLDLSKFLETPEGLPRTIEDYVEGIADVPITNYICRDDLRYIDAHLDMVM